MRKMGWIVVAVVLALAGEAPGQVDTAWVKLYNAGGIRMSHAGLAATESGRLYVVGSSDFGEPRGSDFTVVCYAADGAILWERQFGGSEIDVPNAITTDCNGNLYITGRSHPDVQTLAYDSNGTLLWSARQPDSAGLSGEGRLITTDDQGNVFVAAGVGVETCTVLKYDRQGIFQWKAEYRGWLGANAGAVGLRVDSNADVIVACWTESYGTYFDYVVLKYREVRPDSVALVWEKKYSSLGRKYDRPSSMDIDSEGNIYVTGFVSQIQPFSGCATVKFRPDGSTAWARVYSDGGSCDGLDISCVPDDTITVCGLSVCASGDRRALVLRYSSDGELLWSSTYGVPGTSTKGVELSIDPVGDVFVACKSEISETAESSILCLSADGSFKWHSREASIPFHSEAFKQLMFVTTPWAGETYFTSLMASSPFRGDTIRTKKIVACQFFDIDILPGSCPNIISTGGIDLDYHGIRPDPAAANRPTVPVAILGTKAFDVSRVDPATIEIAGRSPLSHRLMDVSRPVAVRERECECTAASADGYTDLVLYFEQEQLIAALAPVTDGEMRTLALSGKTKTGVPLSGSDCVTIKEGPIRVSPFASAGEKSESGFAAYPNPFNAATVVSFYLTTVSDVRLDVYDVLGRRVATLADGHFPAGDHQVSCDAADWASGVYFARLTTSTGMMTRKLVLVR